MDVAATSVPAASARPCATPPRRTEAPARTGARCGASHIRVTDPTGASTVNILLLLATFASLAWLYLHTATR